MPSFVFDDSAMKILNLLQGLMYMSQQQSSY